jgi:hypothetical protein
VAITTQAQFRAHVCAALKATVQAEPRLFLGLIPGLIAYGRTGADPREAMEMLFTWAWQHLRGGAFNGHELRHVLLDAGVPAHLAENIPERPEP